MAPDHLLQRNQLSAKAPRKAAFNYCLTALAMVTSTHSLCAQTDVAPAPPNWTAQQDHQNMMEQLGIKALRPGPSGRVDAPNGANYDPAKANPYPDLPDPLTLKNGRRVTTPELWWEERRPEIVEDF